MSTRSAKWLDRAAWSVSIFLACVVVSRVLPPDYRGGGGLVWLLIWTAALVFRFLISLVLDRMIERNEKGKEDHAA
jgi:hypothetical protein